MKNSRSIRIGDGVRACSCRVPIGRGDSVRWRLSERRTTRIVGTNAKFLRTGVVQRQATPCSGSRAAPLSSVAEREVKSGEWEDFVSDVRKTDSPF